MADHNEAQDYKANGPTDAGFRTGGDNTNIRVGVDAAGFEIGVHGTGKAAGIEHESILTVGVKGEGDTGVFGKSPGGPGVYGESDLGFGVEGIGGGLSPGVYGEGIIGVKGFGRDAEQGSDRIGVQGIIEKGDGTGVKGDVEEGGGPGVEGHSHNGPGIYGTSDNAYGGIFKGNLAQILLEPSLTTVGAPKIGHHKPGEFFVDAKGTLFYCTNASPLRWQQVAGPSLLQNIFSTVTTAIAKMFGHI